MVVLAAVVSVKEGLRLNVAKVEPLLDVCRRGHPEGHCRASLPLAIFLADATPPAATNERVLVAPGIQRRPVRLIDLLIVH